MQFDNVSDTAETEEIKGRIIRLLAGFYYVTAQDGKIYECKAKGSFRNDGIKPLVGDFCIIRKVEESDPDPDALPVGNIEKILERQNELLRPPVANVDQALVVFALKAPDPNFTLLDTFLLRLQLQDIPVIIAFNKTDLDEDGTLREQVKERFAHTGYPICFLCVKQEQGIEELKQLLEHKCTALAGPSGVGKSSLINKLASQRVMETGKISKKTARGKHTTRHSELICAGEDTYLFDTPGFTSLGTQELSKEDIAKGFIEIGKWEDECRFAGCSHISEPDCGVKKKLAEGLISPMRYESYVKMYQECRERKRY